MIELYCADALDVLRQLSDNSVDSLITDPPAGIGFMGKSWDAHESRVHFIAELAPIFREVLRVLKPGAHGFVWALPRTSHWTASALEDAGFEVRDVITHLFGSGFPKSLDVSKAIDAAAGDIRNSAGTTYGENLLAGARDGPKYLEHSNTEATSDDAKQWAGWGTALKPGHEDYVLVRKPLISLDADRVLGDACEELGVMLCQSLFAANPVAVRLLSNRSDSKATVVFDSVRWFADVLNTLDSLEPSERMDTCRSPGAVSTILNIVSSWKSILGGLYSLGNTFTIETEIVLTTELTTLKFLILSIMGENMHPGVTNQDGLMFDADTAEHLLGVLSVKSNYIRTLSVLDHVTQQADFNANLGGERQRDEHAMIKGACGSEHWVLVRKPMAEATVAANVLAYGTGALNIDASRIGMNGVSYSYERKGGSPIHGGGHDVDTPAASHPAGRWPANVVLSHNDDCEDQCTDGCAVAALDAQSGQLHSGDLLPGHKRGDGPVVAYGGGGVIAKAYGGDTGGASRFFRVFKEGVICPHCGEEYIAEESMSAGKNMVSNTDNSHTDGYGSNTSALSPKDAKYITGTETPLITNSETLNVSQPKNMMTFTHVCAKITSTLTGSSIEDANLVSDTVNSDALPLELPEHGKVTAESVRPPNLLNGGQRIANTTTPICENTTDVNGSRFYYIAKPSSREKNGGCDDLPEAVVRKMDGGDYTHNSGSVASSKTAPNATRNVHPTVKPVQLMRYLITMITPPGGLVVDPFLGSGTTAVACREAGFDCIGIDNVREYIDIAKARVAHISVPVVARKRRLSPGCIFCGQPVVAPYTSHVSCEEANG